MTETAKNRGVLVALATALVMIFGYSTPQATPRDLIPPSINGPWTFCADENAVCEFDGTANTAYGDNGHYAGIDGVTDEVNCSNAAFGGDPWSGHAKGCWFHHIVPDENYSYCADEQGTCTFTGYSGTVAFGAGDYWFFAHATDSLDCTDEAIGDPDVGVSKTCYFKYDLSPRAAALTKAPADSVLLQSISQTVPTAPQMRGEKSMLSRTAALRTKRLPTAQTKGRH
jgi:hypothetical protein